MRQLHPVTFAFLLGIGGLHVGVAGNEPLAAVDGRWRHIRSPNFELYSHARDSEARDVLHNLELLRAVFIARFKVEERERTEVTVYQFRTLDEFRCYAPESLRRNERMSGCYHRSRDRAVILLAPSSNEDWSRQIVFHEYVHHLIRSAELNPAPWFNEGMAELFSAIRVAENGVEIGRPHETRLMALRREKLLPLKLLFDAGPELFASGTGEHIGLFYAQSWALLHFWYFGESKLPDGAVTKFVRAAGERRLPATIDLGAFFRECFGIDFAEMQRRLESYIAGGRYRFARQPRPEVAPPSGYIARAMARDEAQLRLAELGLRMNRSAAAHVVLLEAIAKPNAEPRLFEVLGAEALRNGDEARAREHWEQAIAAGTANVAIHRELARLESRTWFRDFDFHFKLPVAAADRLRDHLLRAIEQSPDQSAPYELLAWVEAFSERCFIPNVNRVQQRFPLLRQKARTMVALALTRVRAGNAAEGMAVLNELEKTEWDYWAACAAEVIRAQVERRPVKPVHRPSRPRETIEHRRAGELPMIPMPSLELP